MMGPPCWDPSKQYRPNTLAVFLSFFPFFLFFFSSFFFFPFFRSPCPIPCSFFVRFRPFVLPFSVWFLYRLLCFCFRFPAFLGGGFCYSVISSRRYTPPRAPCEPEVCVFPLRAVFFLYSVADTFIFFFSSCPFSISIWTSFVFILSFSCGYYAVSSVSVSAGTRLAYVRVWYVWCILIRTYADLTFFFCLRYQVPGIRFVSVIVCIIFCFFFVFLGMR